MTSQNYNLDRAFAKVGEYGRAQWLLTFVNAVARNAGTYMYYPFSYLVLEQFFLCDNNKTGIEESCTASDICLAKETDPSFSNYRVDTSYQYYMENWYTEMDLLCMTPATISFMITAYYIGFAIGGLFFAWPDKFGRKKSLMFGLFLACISQTVMIWVPGYWMRFWMFGLSGLSQIKNSVSYVWLSECTSREYKTRAFTMINVFDAFPMVFTCFYFMFISKNWIHLSVFFCVLSYLALFAAIFCPESPRWLLVNGNSEGAIKSLNSFAKMNKTPYGTIPPTAVFVEDPTNVQAALEAAGLSEKRSHLASNFAGELDTTPLTPALINQEPFQGANNNDHSPLIVSNKRGRFAAQDNKLNISHLGAIPTSDKDDEYVRPVFRKTSLDHSRIRGLNILDISR